MSVVENHKYYKISEFAEKVGVTATTLRNWERKGLLLPHHVTPTGYRYYADEQLEELLNGEKTKSC